MQVRTLVDGVNISLWVYKMSKTLKVCVISISALILVMILLLTLVFTIKDVKVNFLTSSASSTLTNAGVKMDLESKGALPLNQSVFFFNRAKSIELVEKAVPKIRVVNLEVGFPNILSVNCVERVPVFALKLTNSTYSYAIVDEDFKAVDTTMSSGAYVQFNFDNIEEFNNLEAGDFVKHAYIEQLKKFFVLLKQFSMAESAIMETFSNIEAYSRNTIDESQLSLKFSTKSGYNIDMYNIKAGTEKKIGYLLNIISNSEITENQVIGD